MMHKTCTRCGELKELSEFYSDKRGSSGVTGRCKACISECKRANYNPVKQAERSKKWRQANKQRAYQITRAWKLANKDRVAVSDKKYREKHKEREAARVAAYAQANPEKGVQRSRRYAMKHPEKMVDAVSKRRAAKRNQYPLWDRELTDFVSAEASLLARIRGELFGFKWHVDHVVPLRGKEVRGLHVWNNLRVIPGFLNVRKSNKLEVAA